MRYFMWKIFQGVANWLKNGDPDYDGTQYKKFKEIESLREVTERYSSEIKRSNNVPSHHKSGMSISHSGMDDDDMDFLLDYYQYADSRLKTIVNQVNKTFEWDNDKE